MKYVVLFVIVIMQVAILSCVAVGATVAAIVLSAINAAFWTITVALIVKDDMDEEKNAKKSDSKDPFDEYKML